MLNTVIIQPPLVQLNTPYPSGAYLLNFFNSLYKEKNISGKVEWFDLSNSFFHKIFCKEGIAHIFKSTFEKALKMADQFDSQGDESSSYQLRRFVSQSESWAFWIDRIIAIVCPGNSKISGREFTHEFIRSAHAPRGMRIENFLSGLDRDVSTDDAQILASLALADLADYITMVYDNNFALIRYAEHLATSTSDFDQALSGLSSACLNEFFKPLLNEKISSLKSEPTLYCITIPFPGCFEAALFAARYIRQTCGQNGLIVFGGGYVNTELRELTEKRLFDFCHLVSYDKGYGSYVQLFDELCKAVGGGITNNGGSASDDCNTSNGGKTFSDGFTFDSFFTNNGAVSFLNSNRFYNFSYLNNNEIIYPLEKLNPDYDRFVKLEHEYVKKITPDYSGIDFSNYPRLADDTNPMHRIWNDGAWLKAYIAHGCYWHRCAFCDTTLDYVKDYCPANVSHLYDSLCVQAEKTGVYGIHFVDEACPPVALEKFALMNLERRDGGKENSVSIITNNSNATSGAIVSKENTVGNTNNGDTVGLTNTFGNTNNAAAVPLTFWGNIRFEKTFDRDAADLLSAGGLTAVSAGIEIATGSGLDAVNKGTDMENIVSACCAFKEAGILIHSYMIFGFWNQNEQDLINSMETLRQMFESGLLDSAFWHKFTLTKHSTVYQEYLQGKHPGLIIIPQKENQFAKNDLHYEGEKKYEKYSDALNAALELWMHGEKLSKPVESYFPFKMPRPSIAKDYVNSLIAKYENNRDKKFTKLPEENSKEKCVWLGGVPILLKSGGQNQIQLAWTYMGELLYADVQKEKGQQIVDLLKSISVINYECSDKEKFNSYKIFNFLGKKLFKEFRGKGLCVLM